MNKIERILLSQIMGEGKSIVGILGIISLVFAVFSLIFAIQHSHGFLLKINTPKNNTSVPQGKVLTVIGKSASSNATNTHCTVFVRTDHHHYIPTTNNLTNWTGHITPIKGNNTLEAKLECYPSGMVKPNLVKHTTLNIVGVAFR